MQCKPGTACCCSACFGGESGCLPFCCGPPIWKAGRGIGITLTIIYIIVFGALLGLTARPEKTDFSSLKNSVKTSSVTVLDGSQDCRASGAVSLSIVGIVFAFIGAVIYAFGAYASSKMNSSLCGAFFFAHVAFQAFFILLGVCGGSAYSKSPRQKDSVLDSDCRKFCTQANPTFTDGVCPSNARAFGGNNCPTKDGCLPDGGTMRANGWVGGGIQLIIMIYLGYIIWSMWQRCKNLTADHLQTSESTANIPMAQTAGQAYSDGQSHAQPVAQAFPVAAPSAHAQPVAQAIPITAPSVSAIPVATAVAVPVNKP